MASFALRPDDGLTTPLPLQNLTKQAEDLAAKWWQRSSRDPSPRQALEELAATTLLSAPLPRVLGGVDLHASAVGWLTLLRILKRIGGGDLSLGRLYEGHINALLLIEQFGSESQRRHWADGVHDGQLFGVWNTEGRDGVQLQPTATGYRLQGAKTFASGAEDVGQALITATLPDGRRQMVVVPMAEAQVVIDPSVWHPLGMVASTSYRVDFTAIDVDHHALLGKPDDYLREPWFGGGAIRFAAVQLGGVAALYRITRDHLRRLNRSDDAFQRSRTAELAMLLETGDLWLTGAAHRAACAERMPRAFLNYARLTRTTMERLGMEAMTLAQRSVGVPGMLQPHPLEHWLRDLSTYLRQPAPDATLTAAGQYLLADDADDDPLWSDPGGDHALNA